MEINQLLLDICAIEWLKFGHDPAHKVEKVQIQNNMGTDQMKKIKDAINSNTLPKHMSELHKVIDTFPDLMLIAHYPNHQEFANPNGLQTACGARPFISDAPTTLLQLYLHAHPEVIINYCREQPEDTDVNIIKERDIPEHLNLEAAESLARLKEFYLTDIGISEEEFEAIVSSETDTSENVN